MRVIQFAQYGAPEMLQLAERELPSPPSGAVRIRVGAAGVNPADFKWRGGMFQSTVPVPLPHVLGYDVAGTIDAIGADVEGFSAGDEVFAMLDPISKGGYAEYALAEASHVARVPAGLALETAAALPTPGLAGYQLIKDHIRPASGETVLVTGAVGAVGRFAVRTALDQGARVLAGVLASQHDLARQLGAAEVFTLGEDNAENIHFDHVADVVGGADVAALCRRLPPHARIMTLATTPIDPSELAATPRFVAVRPDGEALAAIADLVVSGKVAIAPPKTMPLIDAALAHAELEAGGTAKVVLRP
jgi:NADPH:quinone reductase